MHLILKFIVNLVNRPIRARRQPTLINPNATIGKKQRYNYVKMEELANEHAFARYKEENHILKKPIYKNKNYNFYCCKNNKECKFQIRESNLVVYWNGVEGRAQLQKDR